MGDVFHDIGIIKDFQKAKLCNCYGGHVYSPKSDKTYSFGGQYLEHIKVGDKVKIFVSFGKIVGYMKKVD